MSNILSNITDAYPDIAPNLEEQYKEIDKCRNIYQNKPVWKKVKRSGLSQNGTRNMAMLNAAKVLSDEFSALSFSEQVDITVNNKDAQEFLEQVLNDNGFWKNFPDFLSKAYALGGAALKVFAENKLPKINYVVADNFVPTAWNGKGIFECAFQTVTVKNKNYYTLIERHYMNNGIPCVDNQLYISDTGNSLGNLCTLDAIYDDMADTVSYKGITVPMFQYFKPAVSNNVDDDSPLGISVFSNAEDTLKALDIAFDSYSREFILGKKRIIVPTACIESVYNAETGERQRYFDATSEVYEAFNSGDAPEIKISDATTELRIEEHISAINSLLNILCFQTGLSAGTLSFDGGDGVKTATEIISRDSKTARTIKNNKNLLTETLEGMCKSILALGKFYGQSYPDDLEVTIGWQDNIIVDDDTLIDRNIKLVSAGLKSKVQAVMDVNKCDEETAQKMLKQIAKEQNVTGLSVDNLYGDKTDNTEKDTEDETDKE